jgi:hypothetical protein
MGDYETCDYCHMPLLPGVGRRPLADGTQICDRCTHYNRHLRNTPGVRRRLVWDIFPHWYYYLEAPREAQEPPQ